MRIDTIRLVNTLRDNRNMHRSSQCDICLKRFKLDIFSTVNFRCNRFQADSDRNGKNKLLSFQSSHSRVKREYGKDQDLNAMMKEEKTGTAEDQLRMFERALVVSLLLLIFLFDFSISSLLGFFLPY